jgi:DNA-binding MarR family transcriptional regulator
VSIPLARLLAMAYRQLIDELHRELAARGWTDVRPAFGFLLLALRDGPVSLRELVNALGTSKQAVSKLSDAMVEAGLVERVVDRHDARAKDLRLTARGKALLAEVEEIYAELEARWATVLGGDGLAPLRRDLEVVIRSAHGGALPPVRPAH